MEITSLTPNIQDIVLFLTAAEFDEVMQWLQAHLSVDADGYISRHATANAIKGIVVQFEETVWQTVSLGQLSVKL